METARYFVKGSSFQAGDPSLQDALAGVYETAERPRCMCVSGGVPMYVAKHREYVVRRMPDTGPQHHPTCYAYEPECGTSGLGELRGEAVIEHTPEKIEVRVDFPLARVPGRALPKGEPTEPAEIQAPRRRMSLRALLHLLYERAGLNRWYPRMEGKRNQGVIHKYLSAAAGDVIVKGEPLSDRLYVPEPFRLENQEEIADRRWKKLAILQSPEDDVQYKMAIVIGEFNGTEATSFGRKVMIKHMPDAPLHIDIRAWERVERAYGNLLRARDADVRWKPRVVMAALIYAKQPHVYQIDLVSMMLATDQWLPINGLHELDLIERLCAERRSFIKPLQYDARLPDQFPNVLLLDAGPSAKRLHVVNDLADAKARAAKDRAVRAEGEDAWVWHNGSPIPDIPHLAERTGRQPAGPTPERPLETHEPAPLATG